MSIDVELTDLAYGGDAVGRYEGRVLFVPGGIPGERVRVEVVEERRGHARATLLEILRPAPERVEPAFLCSRTVAASGNTSPTPHN